MDRFEEFCRSVMSYVNHATPKERREVELELREHLADRAESFEARGLPQAEAEARAVAAMGDAETIGRELNRQFPLGWLVLSRAALVVCVTLVLLLIFFPMNSLVWRIQGNLEARFVPMAAFGGSEALEGRLWHYDPGLTAKVMDTTIRVYDIAATEKEIYVYFAQYADSLLDVPIQLMDRAATYPTNSGGYYGPYDSCIQIPFDSYSEEDGFRIQREDLLVSSNHVRIDYNHNGHDFSLTVPLGGGEA